MNSTFFKRVSWTMALGLVAMSTADCSDSGSDTGKALDTSSGTDTGTGTDADTDSDNDGDADQDTSTGLDEDTDTVADSDTDLDVDMDTDGDSDTDGVSDSDTDTDTYDDSSTEIGRDSETSTDRDIDTVSDIGTDIDTGSGGDTDIDGDADADGDIDSDISSEMDTELGTDSVSGSDTGSESPTDTGNASDAVVCVNQILDELSTIVLVESITAAENAWLVIHAAVGGSPGEVVGVVKVSPGSRQDVPVFLSRPAADAEDFIAMLHLDSGASGTWEPGVDTAVLNAAGDPVQASFTVTVPDGTPAVRITVGALGSTAYDVTSAEPSTFEDTVGPETANQTLVLRTGLRYEIVNTASDGHPFELLDMGSSSDIVLLSQAVTGSFENDDTVKWREDDAQRVRFTLSEVLAAVLNGYRCSKHPISMRGDITVM